MEARRCPVHPSRQVWCHPTRLLTERMTMTTLPLRITGGVDTHLDVNVVAALEERGALLGVESFDTTADGYRRTVAWLREFGTVELVGVEGTGSYGAGLTRHLLAEGNRSCRGRPTEPAAATQARQVRSPRRDHRSPGRPVR